MAGRLGAAQQLSLVGIFLGAVMCLIGLGAPYWLVADVGQTVSVHMGVFVVCGNILGQSDCEWYDTDADFMYAVRACSAVCVIVGGICGLVALCLACCGSGRLIVLGCICFVAGVVGAVAPGVFASNFDELMVNSMAGHVFSYGFAFYLFCAGVGVIEIASILACVAPPTNPNAGMVFGYNQSGPSVFMTQSQSHMQTGHNPYVSLQNSSNMAIGTSGPGVNMFSSSNTSTSAY